MFSLPSRPIRQSAAKWSRRWAGSAYLIGAEAVWLANQSDRAGQIRVPTLVLCGSEDKVTPPALSRELTHLIPGARYEEIGRSGHLSNLEQPEAFNTLVGAFIRGVDSRSS